METYLNNLLNVFGDTSLSVMSEVHVWHLDLTVFFLTDGRWYFVVLNNNKNISR